MSSTSSASDGCCSYRRPKTVVDGHGAGDSFVRAPAFACFAPHLGWYAVFCAVRQSRGNVLLVLFAPPLTTRLRIVTGYLAHGPTDAEQPRLRETFLGGNEGGVTGFLLPGHHLRHAQLAIPTGQPSAALARR